MNRSMVKGVRVKTTFGTGIITERFMRTEWDDTKRACIVIKYDDGATRTHYLSIIKPIATDDHRAGSS